MTGNELKQVFKAWGLTAAEGAKVLCLHSNKLSEYLDDVTRIPCAVRFHIEAINLLPEADRERLLQRRKSRTPHGE